MQIRYEINIVKWRFENGNEIETNKITNKSNKNLNAKSYVKLYLK